jgi:hypothetical protein
MKSLIAVTLLTLTLLTLALAQTPTKPPDTAKLEIAQFSYKTKMIKRERLASLVVSMQPPKLNNSTIKLPDRNPHEKNNPILIRQRDASDRQKDLRALEHMPPGPPPIMAVVFEFQAQMRNSGTRPISKFVWAYRSSANPPDFVDQQYLCNVTLQPGETKPIKLISPIPRRMVVNVSAIATPVPPLNPGPQDMIIYQLQYADGTTWQHADWTKTVLLTRAGAQNLKPGKCIAL